MPFVQTEWWYRHDDENKPEAVWCAFRHNVPTIHDSFKARLQHGIGPDQPCFVHVTRMVTHGVLRDADLDVIHVGYKGAKRGRAIARNEHALSIGPAE